MNVDSVGNQGVQRVGPVLVSFLYIHYKMSLETSILFSLFCLEAHDVAKGHKIFFILLPYAGSFPAIIGGDNLSASSLISVRLKQISTVNRNFISYMKHLSPVCLFYVVATCFLSYKLMPEILIVVSKFWWEWMVAFKLYNILQGSCIKILRCRFVLLVIVGSCF